MLIQALPSCSSTFSSAGTCARTLSIGTRQCAKQYVLQRLPHRPAALGQRPGTVPDVLEGARLPLGGFEVEHRG